MTAKQTVLSASLAVLLAVPARAEPPEQPPGEVPPMPLIPKRKPTGTFQVGAGYSTDDGFGFLARIAQPRLFGTDKGLSLTAELDERTIDMRMRYEDPTLFDALRLRGDLYSTRRLYPGFTREGSGADLSLTRTIAPHLDVFVGYRAELVRVEPNDITLAARGVSSEPLWRGGFLSALRAGIAYSNVDQRVYPKRGTSVGTSIEVADAQLGSELDFVRIDSWFGHHRPLGPFTLHLGAKTSTITDVPLSERLHFDGSSDIRGYAPGAVGPKDPITGLPTGGNVLWSARGELEAPLVGDLRVAGFVDVGGLHTREAGETAASTGFGLIWRSPIGPLRFDVAFPLTGEDRGPRYIFGVGGMF